LEQQAFSILRVSQTCLEEINNLKLQKKRREEMRISCMVAFVFVFAVLVGSSQALDWALITRSDEDSTTQSASWKSYLYFDFANVSPTIDSFAYHIRFRGDGTNPCSVKVELWGSLDIVYYHTTSLNVYVDASTDWLPGASSVGYFSISYKTTGSGTAYISDASVQFLGNPSGGSKVGENNPFLRRGKVSSSPNPFRESTRIYYDLEKSGKVTIEIYDLSGRLVTKLVDRQASPGHYSIVWDGIDLQGNKVPSGVYFYKVRTGEKVSENRILRLR